MSEQDFRNSLHKWICHKIVLAKVSIHYQNSIKRNNIGIIQNRFADFIRNKAAFSVYQLAGFIIKNEETLFACLPNESNPSYQKALIILQELIQTAKNLKGV